MGETGLGLLSNLSFSEEDLKSVNQALTTSVSSYHYTTFFSLHRTITGKTEAQTLVILTSSKSVSNETLTRFL